MSEPAVLKRLQRSSKGAGMLEFSIVLVVLLITLAGIVDIGLFISSVNTVSSAVRTGVRAAANMENITAEDDPRIEEIVRMYLEPFSYLNVKNVRTTMPGDGTIADGAGGFCDEKIRVRVDGEYMPLLMQLFGMRTIAISRSTSMRYNNRRLCL